MEIKPTYCTFEQAKLLKEKGFKQNEMPSYLLVSYDKTNVSNINPDNLQIGDWIGYYVPGKTVNAPEQWQVCEWLRVKHDIHVTYDVGLNGYYGLIKYRHSNSSVYLSKWTNEQENPLNSPQEAISASIDYILINFF